MRTLTYYVAVTLDGRIAARDHDFSAIPVVGDHIDMILREYRDTVPGVGLEALGLTADNRRFDTVLMGWNTYQAGGIPDPYPHLRQLVFSRSRTAEDVDDPGIELTAEDPVDVVRRLKAEDGAGIWLCGGGQLASALVDEIDRLVLKINPLVFGDGIPLFDGGDDPRTFRRTAATPYESGVIVAEYERA